MSKAMDISVVVAFAPAPRRVHERVLKLPAGTTVAQALAASGLDNECPELRDVLPDQTQAADTGIFGIWGRKTTLQHVLRDGDRLEIYRPLRVDPKVARRERFEQQGAKRAGLFAQRRAGAKAGY